jgi:cobalt-zinc-cadmium efflux system outer membrane protein
MASSRSLTAVAIIALICLPGSGASEPSNEQPVAVESAGPLALEDALALALMHNPELQAFSWEARASEARTLQAKKIPNPELDVRLYRLGIPRRLSQPDEERTRVVVRQELEWGGQRGRRKRLARAEEKLADLDYEVKRLEIVALVTSRFASVVGAQRRVDSTRRSVEFFERMEATIEKLVETGDIRSIEGNQSRRQVALRRIELGDAEAELAAARYRLAATWNSHDPLFTEAAGDLEHMQEMPSLDELLEMAKQSPLFARWNAEVLRSEAALALAKSERMPSLTAGAGARWEDDKGGEDWLVDLEISLPIFDTGKAGVAEGRHNAAKAQVERQAAEAESVVMISEFYHSMAASRARAEILRDEVLPTARAALEAFQKGFGTDVAAPGDLFDAMRDLTRAELEYTEALVEYHQAVAALEGLVGP